MKNEPIKVTLLTKNNCPRCTVVKNKYTREGVSFEIINAEEDHTIYSHLNGKTAMDFVYEDLVSREMPVTVVDQGEVRDWWSGVLPYKMDDLIQRIKSGKEIVETVKVSIPEVTEELVQELLSDTFGSLKIEPNLFAPDGDREAITTKDSATIPLVRYTSDGQIGARFTAQLALTLEGSDND